jgi:hypothetical protein
MTEEPPFNSQDELLHEVDPADDLWNESWFLSWMPSADAPAAFYRLGVLPNQGRAWLWFYLHNGNEWLCFEQPRLDLDHFDLSEGATYDKWGLAFGYRPVDPLRSGEFFLRGLARVHGGPRNGALVPVDVALDLTAVAPCYPTGPRHMSGAGGGYANYRFEQSLAVHGHARFDGREIAIDCNGHRDRSWGTRNWRIPFFNADLHGKDLQIYLAGPRQPGSRPGRGYIRRPGSFERIASISGRFDYAPDLSNLRRSTLTLNMESGAVREVWLDAASDSVSWDMSHTAAPWDNWPYWRTRLIGQLVGEEQVLAGWFDASHYGASGPD